MNTPTPDQPPVDRAALRRQLAEALWARARRDIVAEWICCDPVDRTHSLCVQGAELLRMTESLIFEGDVTLADAVLDTVLPAAVDRAALRKLAEAVLGAVETALCDTLLPAAREEALAGIAAVLPAPADRAAVLRQEAARIRAHCPDHLDADSAWLVCHCDVADDMERRLAAEAPQTETPSTVLLAAADRAEQIQNGDCRCSWCETCCGGCTGCACHHIAAELRRTAAEAPPAKLHACGNCEGVAPDSCLNNSDRPAGAQPATPDTPQRLPYHDDRNALRRSLLDASRDYFPATGVEGATADPALRMASILGSGYAYNLAAAIEWVARHVGTGKADELAAWLSDSLTNGDEDGLNEDIEPEPAGSAAAPAQDTPRSLGARLLDAVTHTGPGYDLTRPGAAPAKEA